MLVRQKSIDLHMNFINKTVTTSATYLWIACLMLVLKYSDICISILWIIWEHWIAALHIQGRKANRNENIWQVCSQRHFLNKILETIFQYHQYDLAEARDMLFTDNLISHLGKEQGQLEASGSTAGTLTSLHLANRFYNEVLLHDIIFFLVPFFPQVWDVTEACSYTYKPYCDSHPAKSRVGLHY